MDNLETEPKSFADYGAAKAKIECEATTKQVQLVFDLLESGGDVASAGKRNLLMTGGLVLEYAAKKPVFKGDSKTESHQVGDEDLKEFEAVKSELNALRAAKAEAATLPVAERQKKNKELDTQSAALDEKVDRLVAKHKDLFRDGLPLIATNSDLSNAVLANFSESRHNVNKGKPTDKGNLKTKEMYAFEQMESLKEPELIKLIRTSLDKRSPRRPSPTSKTTGRRSSAWMDNSLRKFELDEKKPHARQKVILDIVDKLEADFPESQGKLAATFGFTPEMKEVAEARFEEMKSAKPEAWDNVKDAHLPPIKGWAGKLPIPLTKVSTTIPTTAALEGTPKTKHRAAHDQTVAKDKELLHRVVGASEGKTNFQAIPNAEAGVNTSFQVKPAAGKTPVALFKPLSPGGESTGEKLAPSLKKHGAKETREVACSAWNEFCGGIGDYPTTIPADFDGQKGSMMAWRDGAKELAAYDLSEVEERFAGKAGEAWIEKFKEEKEQDKIQTFQPKKGAPIKFSVDGRIDPDTKEKTTAIGDLKAECDKSLAKKKADLKVLVASADEEACQDLMALHVATLQMDAENACNVMFTTADGKLKPFAIDGGLSAPDKIYGSDLKNPCWCDWPQANKAWSKEQAAKFEAIDVKEAAMKLKGHMDKSPVGALEDESLLRMMASTQCLKLAAQAGLTPKMTWNLIQGIEKSVLDATAIAKKDKTDFTQAFLDEFTKLTRKTIEETPWTDEQKKKAAERKIDEKIDQTQKKLGRDAEFGGKLKVVIQGVMAKGTAGLDEELLAKVTWQFTEQIGQLTDTAAAIVKNEKTKDFLDEFAQLAEKLMTKTVAATKAAGAKSSAIQDFKKKEDFAAESKADKSSQATAKKNVEEMLKKGKT